MGTGRCGIGCCAKCGGEDGYITKGALARTTATAIDGAMEAESTIDGGASLDAVGYR